MSEPKDFAGELPESPFRPDDEEPIDWRAEEFDDEEPDDDEPLAETPPGTIELLGFDPLDLDDGEDDGEEGHTEPVAEGVEEQE